MLNQEIYCRSCAVSNPTPMIHLTTTWKNKDLSKIFEECMSINIITDNFSKILCVTCYEKLMEFHNFRLLTQDTHAKLIKQLGLVEIKEEDVETVKEEIIVTPLMLQRDYESHNRITEVHGSSNKTEYDEIRTNFSEEVKSDDEIRKSKTSKVCIGCQKSFKSTFQLNKHLKESKGDNWHLWRCFNCTNTFNTKRMLKSHLLKTHHKEKSFEEKYDCCPHCAKFVKNLRGHISVVHKKLKRYFCDICNRGCVTKDTLRAHLRTHSGEKPYKCTFPECHKAFKQSGQLRQHEKNFHGPTIDPVPCENCGKLFKTKYTLKEHRKIHIGGMFKCNQCEATFTVQRYLQEHVKDVHDPCEPVVCSDCGKIFKSQKKLLYHRRQHEGTNFICEICDRFFVNKRLLLDHRNSQHDKAQRYVCEVQGCGSAFYRMDNLRRHRKKVHKIVK